MRDDGSRGSMGLVLLLGVAFALAAVLLTWTAVEKAAFDARVERIRQAGDPVDPTDLAQPPVPDEQNAAKLLEKATAWLDRRREQEDNEEGMLWEGASRREEWTRAHWDRLDAYLESVAPYFEMLEQVPQRPHWRSDLKWADGVDMLDPSLSRTRDAVHYIFARVELDRWEHGRTERAARAAILLLDYADRFRMPYVIGYLVKITIRDRVVQLVRVAAAKPGFDAALFRRLVDPRLARAIPPVGPPAEVLKEERALMLWVIRAWLAGDSVTVDDGWQRFPLCQPLLYRDATRMLELFDQAIAACGTTPERATAVAARLGSPDGRVGLLNLAAPLLCGVHRKLFEQYARSTAIRRLARVAMALLEYRQVHSEWPPDLAALGEMPVDPYSGAPFQYTRTEKGARIRAACPERKGETLEAQDLAWSFQE